MKCQKPQFPERPRGAPKPKSTCIVSSFWIFLLVTLHMLNLKVQDESLPTYLIHD